MSKIDEVLRFVKGAVAKKNFEPALTHFRIENGTIRSSNGIISLSSPIDLDIECTPDAGQFVKAISNSGDDMVLTMLPSGRLSIRSEKFKAFVNCHNDENVPHPLPEGDIIEFEPSMLITAIQELMPFVGDDASRSWTNGIHFNGQFAYATNNVTMAQYWLKGINVVIPFTIPRVALTELLRIKLLPISIQADANSATFHFEDSRWIRTNLLEGDWPLKTFETILSSPSDCKPLPDDFFDGLASIKDFTNNMNCVFIKGSTLQTNLEKNIGASFELSERIVGENIVCFAHPILNELKNLSNLSIDLSTYPKPCLFYAGLMRGAIMGVRI